MASRLFVASILSSAAIVSLAPTVQLDAQAQADFTGTWTMDEKRSGSPSHEGSTGPVVWVIQQSADRVVLERQRGTDRTEFTYTILAKMPTPAERAIKAPTADAPGHRAYWDTNRLVLETLQTIQGKTVTAREVLSLNANEMTVERVVEVEHGYTMKGAQNFNSVRDVFVRTGTSLD